MNQITKINPAIAPQAYTAISSRCLASGNGTAVFQGLLYEITVGGDVWHVGNGNQTFKNTWDDTRFGFEVATPTPATPAPITPMKTATQATLPQGWELLRFPSTIEIRNDSGELVHAHPVPYSPIPADELRNQAISFALDPCLRNPSPSGHAQNGFQLHYKA